MKNFLLTLLCGALSFSFMGYLSASETQKYHPITGTLYPAQITKVSSQVQGKMKQVLVDVGDYVTKDQVIAVLDPLFFELDFQKMKVLADLAKVAFEESELDFNRMKKLWEKESGENPSISKKQFEDAFHRFKQKKLAYEQALIDMQRVEKVLEETKIKAPYDGIITQRFLDCGESITVVPVTPIVEIMDISTLRLEFSLPQDLLSSVNPGDPVIIENDDSAIIEKIFPNVDISSRCFKCRVLVNNTQKNLKPGLFIRGQIPLKKVPS